MNHEESYEKEWAGRGGQEKEGEGSDSHWVISKISVFDGRINFVYVEMSNLNLIFLKKNSEGQCAFVSLGNSPSMIILSSIFLCIIFSPRHTLFFWNNIAFKQGEEG